MNNILYFPFVPFGNWLRELSLSGSTGNIAAIILYVAASLIPFLFFLFLKIRRRSVRTDYLLLLMSGYMFFMIYFIINPCDFGMNMEEAWKMCLNVTFISLLIAYLVFRVLEVSKGGSLEILQSRLIQIIWLAIVCYVIDIIYLAGTLPSSISRVADANTGVESSALTMTYLFLVLRKLVDLIPVVFSMLICYAGIRLLKAMQEEVYGEKAVCASEKLDFLCRMSLVVMVSSELTVNLLQIIFSSCLRNIETGANIPISEILIAIAVLLINRYLRLSRQLKEENDAFI